MPIYLLMQGTCCCLLSVMHDTYLMHSSYLKCLNVYKKRVFSYLWVLPLAVLHDKHTHTCSDSQRHPYSHSSCPFFFKSFINNLKKEIELNLTKIRIRFIISNLPGTCLTTLEPLHSWLVFSPATFQPNKTPNRCRKILISYSSSNRICFL